MAESDMRKRVLTALKSLHAIPVENRTACPGTPDVAYIGGWCELKWLRAWPKRADTVVEVEHFTAQQRVWLRQHRRAGGLAFVLLQCKREWLLFDGVVAADILGHAPRADLFQRATKTWVAGLNDEDLRKWLTSRTTI